MIEEELKNSLSNPLLLNVDILKLQHLSMKFSQIDKSEINFKKKNKYFRKFRLYDKFLN